MFNCATVFVRSFVRNELFVRNVGARKLTKGACELWGGPLLPFAHFPVCEVLLQK